MIEGEMFGHGVEATSSGVQAAMHDPCARLQAGAVPTPKAIPAVP